MAQASNVHSDQPAGRAALALSRLVGGAASDGIRLQPVRRGHLPSFPLSPAQEALWFLQQLAPESTAYHCPVAWQLTGPLDRRALATSITRLVTRHEVLRTRFIERDGIPVQIVDRPGPVRLAVESLDRTADLPRRLREHSSRPFDLSRGQLLRPVLLQLSPAEHVLLLSLHHIVFDGWSEGVLWRDLAVIYRRLAGHDEPPQSALPLQYLDFAVRQRDFLAGPGSSRLRDFWRQQLTGLVSLDLPTDRPRPPLQTFGGDMVAATVPPRLAAAIDQLTRAERTTSFVGYLTAFAFVLAQWSGQRDVVLGTITSGRASPQLADLIGLFVNTLVLRVDVSGTLTRREALRRVRQTVADAMSHEAMPFPTLVDMLRPRRDPSRSPLFQVLFAYSADDLVARPPELPGITASRLAADLPVARFDLALNIEKGGGEVQSTVEFNADLFDRTTAERLSAEFLDRLARLATDPDGPAFPYGPAKKG